MAERAAPIIMAICWSLGRRAQQETGLQILRSRPAVGSRHANDAPHGKRGDVILAGPSSPRPKKSDRSIDSVATVIPEIGLEDEPISPVRREETVTKRKPNRRIRTRRGVHVQPARRPNGGHQSRQPPATTFMDRSFSVRGAPSRACAHPRQNPPGPRESRAK